MPLPLFGAPRLIRDNSRVTIQSYSVTIVGGGTVETYNTVVERNVRVLITNVTSQRSLGGDGPFDTEVDVQSGDLSGDSANLARLDTRLLVTASENASLVGKYLRVDRIDSHAQGLGNLQSARVRIRWSQMIVQE